VARVDSIKDELCPCADVVEAAGLTYNRQLSSLPGRADLAGKALLVCGWFQSWKYTVGVDAELRRHLRLLPDVSAPVRDYLERIRPSAWTRQSFDRIGIHVRAGDVLRRVKWQFGYTVPRRPYFQQAMSRFVHV